MLHPVTVSNGLDLAPDGHSAYYIDSGQRRTDVFDYDRESGLTTRRAFAEVLPEHGTPDGLTVDEDGGIWVALWGGSAVRRYLPEGGSRQSSNSRSLRSPHAPSADPASTSFSLPHHGMASTRGPAASRGAVPRSGRRHRDANAGLHRLNQTGERERMTAVAHSEGSEQPTASGVNPRSDPAGKLPTSLPCSGSRTWPPADTDGRSRHSSPGCRRRWVRRLVRDLLALMACTSPRSVGISW